MQALLDCTADLEGVHKVAVVARDGAVLLHNGDKRDHFGDYLAYTAVSAEQVRPHLGFTGPEHVIMEESSGERILILFHRQLIIGLTTSASVSPHLLLDRLLPVVGRLRV